MEALYAESHENKSENLLEALKFLQTIQKNPISITENEKPNNGSNLLP